MTRIRFVSSLLVLIFGMAAFLTPRATYAAGIVGSGTPASCTDAALTAALAGGGTVTFNCGPAPHTIAITSSKTITGNTTINGGGLISLSGTTRPILSVPEGATLNLANITIRDNGPTEFSIGTTMSNAGTTTLVGVRFINNNYLSIRNNGTLTVSGSHFEDNTSSGFAGAISNEGGTLTVHDSSFVANRSSPSHEGGAIYNGTSATTTIVRSTFTGNASAIGGAISNYGTMTVSATTFTGNTATDGGGAIAARGGAELTVTNTTISGNTARRGGGVYGVGSIPGNVATLTNVTLANNIAPTTAANQGGANVTLNGVVSITLRNTIITTSNAALDNCVNVTTNNAGRISNGGNNLQFPGTSCNESDGTAIPTADPKIGPLADNGGLTRTHAIAADSPARNAASSAFCPLFDQRGVVRPQGPACDIGAFEYGAAPDFTGIASGCVPAGGAAFTLVVNGSNFIPGPNGTRILLNGTPLATTFVSPTQLLATVPAGAITGSTAQVAISTPTVDGGTSIVRALASCSIVYIPMVMR